MRRRPRSGRERGRLRAFSELPSNQRGPTRPERLSAERRARRLAPYEEVVALAKHGVPEKQIARRTGLSRRAVIDRLAADRFPERAARQHPPRTVSDAVADRIATFYDAGGTNAAALARELIADGYRGSPADIRRALQRLRQRRPPATAHPVEALPVTLPPARAVAWLLRKPAGACHEDECRYLDALADACPSSGQARTLALRLGAMLATRDVNALRPRRADAEGGTLRTFAAGLRRDFYAVLAVLRFPWSRVAVARGATATHTRSKREGRCVPPGAGEPNIFLTIGPLLTLLRRT
jgi:hypothetical protein